MNERGLKRVKDTRVGDMFISREDVVYVALSKELDLDSGHVAISWVVLRAGSQAHFVRIDNYYPNMLWAAPVNEVSHDEEV